MNAPPKIVKLYKIVSDKGDKVYIGSTTQHYLKTRWNAHQANHKSGYGPCSSSILFDEYGLENCRCELIETFPFTTKEDMLQRERQQIDLHQTAVNAHRPMLTQEEKRLETNARIRKSYHKLKEDPEWLAKRRQASAEWTKKAGSEECGCGLTYTLHHKSRHLRTKKHLAWAESQ